MNNVIYFIERQSDKAVKIGTTINLKARLSSIKRGHGDIKLLGVVDGGVVRERLLHWIFSDNRLDGEFFKPNQELLEIIEQYTTIPEHEKIPDIELKQVKIYLTESQLRAVREYGRNRGILASTGINAGQPHVSEVIRLFIDRMAPQPDKVAIPAASLNEG